ncbi:MAG: tetratricopeptide repeat protein [Polyangia bacterium]
MSLWTPFFAAAVSLPFLIGCGHLPPHGAYTPRRPPAEELRWEELHRAERAGRLEEALRGYSEMCSAPEPYSRACYDSTRVMFELGPLEAARRRTAEFLLRFPDEALAPAAARRLARSYVRSGEIDRGVEEIGRLIGKTEGGEVNDSLIYELARLHREAGRREAEAEALDRIASRGRWQSQLWDDSLWHLVEIRREQGDTRAEQRRLEQLLDAREESHLIGSYDSPYHDDALLRLGELKRERGDIEGALEAFDRLAGWETSGLRDDAMLEAARLRLDQGRREECCDLLEELIEKMPESVGAREATELMERSGCPGE